MSFLLSVDQFKTMKTNHSESKKLLLSSLARRMLDRLAHSFWEKEISYETFELSDWYLSNRKEIGSKRIGFHLYLA